MEDDLNVPVMMALQEPVQAAIDALIASGEKTGLQVAVLHAGHVVADAVAGIAEWRTGAPVEPGTLFFATSAGKGVAASVAHVLVEHGELDYEQRAVDVWPEFGAHGKGRVTVRDVLVHAAGVRNGLPDVMGAGLQPGASRSKVSTGIDLRHGRLQWQRCLRRHRLRRRGRRHAQPHRRRLHRGQGHRRRRRAHHG